MAACFVFVSLPVLRDMLRVAKQSCTLNLADRGHLHGPTHHGRRHAPRPQACALLELKPPLGRLPPSHARDCLHRDASRLAGLWARRSGARGTWPLNSSPSSPSTWACQHVSWEASKPGNVLSQNACITSVPPATICSPPVIVCFISQNETTRRTAAGRTTRARCQQGTSLRTGREEMRKTANILVIILAGVAR